MKKHESMKKMLNRFLDAFRLLYITYLYLKTEGEDEEAIMFKETMGTALSELISFRNAMLRYLRNNCDMDDSLIAEYLEAFSDVDLDDIDELKVDEGITDTDHEGNLHA